MSFRRVAQLRCNCTSKPNLAICFWLTERSDHGEDWALAAVELSAQCSDWAEGQL